MDEEGQIEIERYIERKKIERKRDKKSVIFYFKQINKHLFGYIYLVFNGSSAIVNIVAVGQKTTSKKNSIYESLLAIRAIKYMEV